VTVVEWNPLTYAIDALRGALIDYNQFDPLLGILIMGASGVALFALALFEFSRV
jgi:ABC-2 type transport system permease protein